MKRLICLLSSFVLLFSLTTPVHAVESNSDTSCNSEPDGTFIPMSSDRYSELVYLLEHGTEEDKQFAVDYIFDYNNSGSTYSWNTEHTQVMDDGSYLDQGFVTFLNYSLGMYIRTVVPASRRGTSFTGYTWVSYGEGVSLPGSGSYEYEGIVEVSLLSNTELYIGVAGNYTIAYEEATSLGISIEDLELSHSTSTTTYYRYYDSGSHVEHTPVKS